MSRPRRQEAPGRRAGAGPVATAAAVVGLVLAALGASSPIAGAAARSSATQSTGGQSTGGQSSGGQSTDRSDPDPDPGGRVEFVAQTPWVGTGGQFGVQFRVVRPTGPSNLEIAVSVYPAVAFRSEFQETLENRIFGEPDLPVAIFPLGGLTAEPNGDYAVAVPATLGSQDGVHPVRVELRDRDDFDVLDEFVTHLVYLPGEHPGTRLGVSIVLPVHRPPALQPDGTRTRPEDAELAQMSAAVDATRALPVSFVPTPETVAALVASSDPRAGTVLKSLREAVDRTAAADQPVARSSIVGGPYVPVSLPALTTGGLDGEVALQLERGAATLTEVLRADPVGGTWVAQEPLDASSLDLLAGRGIERVVATEAGLTPIPDQLITLTGPFELEGERTSVQGAAADAGLAAHFDGEGNPALQAAHLLADLAVLYLDLPGEKRGVVALAPRDWKLDPLFLETVVAGLANHPVVEAMSLDTLFSTVPDATDLGEPLIRRPTVDPGGDLAGVVGQIRSVRGRLVALGSVLGATNAVSADLGERMLVSQSADFRSARQRDPYLAGVQRAIDGQLGAIEMPQNRSITLTARRGEIPVTFQNHTGHPVKVIVRMESDKLDFPRGETLEIDLTRLNTTHRFPVVARTSGAFPIRITLESPDGRLVVGRARLTVRSTATSGVGLGISVGAALFLALWWGRHAQRGRRAARLMEPSEVLAPRTAAPPATPPVPVDGAPARAAPASRTPGSVAAPVNGTRANGVVPAPAAAPGATVLPVPHAPDPPSAAPVTPPPTPSNETPGDTDNESPPVPAPGTLGGG